MPTEPKLSKDILRRLRVDMDEALSAVRAKYSLQSLMCGKCTYSPDGSFTMKVEGLVEGGMDRDAERYANHANLLGLPPLGTIFTSGGKPNKITGLNTTGTKVIAERDGKRYVWQVDVVQRLCKVAA